MTQSNSHLTAPVMPWTGTPWRRAVVFGLGLSGRAAASWLLARGIEVVAFDQRGADEIHADPAFADLHRNPGLRLQAGSDRAALPAGLAWQDVDGLVVSPGVPQDRPLVTAARAAGVPVIGEVELAFPFLEGTVLAITGSNGKSTTTALTAALLRGAGLDAVACGNYGEPLIQFADRGISGAGSQEALTPTWVAELSSFQLETIDLFRPQAAALLNVAADHLDRYDGFAGYRRAKLRIFERQQPGDVAILNADDPSAASAAPELRARCRSFSRLAPVADGCWLAGDGKIWEASPDLAEPRVLFAASDVPLPGVHNLENAMAAALLALAGGASAERLVNGLRDFRGLPHRLEHVATADGVPYYDDSKGTNPAAVVKSLEGFDDAAVHLILGGQFKGGDLHELMAMAARKAARVYLIGASTEEFALELDRHGVAWEPSGTLDVAVGRAATAAKTGQAVVLSPACASFDQFKNYIERGKVFQRLVHERSDARKGRHGA